MIVIEYSENMYVLDEQMMATISAFQYNLEDEICCRETSPDGFICTRDPSHQGVHIASGDEVVAVWGEACV